MDTVDNRNKIELNSDAISTNNKDIYLNWYSMHSNEYDIRDNLAKITSNTDAISTNSREIGDIMHSIEMQSLVMFSEK